MQHLELIESYAHQVSRFLPADERQAVYADVSAAVQEEVEARADEAGREPEAGDVEQVLMGFGHPLKVAAGYQPPRYLIGPELYPAFIRTWSYVAIGGFVLLTVFGLAFGYLDDWSLGPWQLMRIMLEGLAWLTLIVFGSFISLQVADEKLDLYGSWKPAQLGRNTLGAVDRGSVVTDLVTEGIFLWWWNGILRIEWLFPEHTGLLALSSAWEPYGIYLNLLFGACFVLHLYVLIKGVWQRSTLVTQIVLYAALVGLGLALLMSGPLVVPAAGLTEFLSEHIQQVVQWVIVVLIGITVWDVYQSLQLWRGKVR
ncbi:MAG: hypothetical protein AAF529_06480 [Pseudomonadota bacterium]